MLKQLKQQLGREFPRLSPELISAVVKIFSGGIHNETFDQFCKKKLKAVKLSTQEKKDQYIYSLILRSSQAFCKKQDSLNSLRKAIAESVTEVRQKRDANPRKIRSIRAPGDASLFKGKRKTKEDHELGRNNKKTRTGPGRSSSA
ncbi:MAG: hypothetical protein NXI01_10340 [Gammaproteobacteria bacterium]|nr:hypothetical protein [Gammaproteobacteria bacterium]